MRKVEYLQKSINFIQESIDALNLRYEDFIDEDDLEIEFLVEAIDRKVGIFQHSLNV